MDNDSAIVAQDAEISALSDDQITAEIKVYLEQIGQGIIEVGRRLIVMKARLQHGEWQNWLKDNFQLSYATAARFIQCTKHFGNVVSIRGFNSTQMIAMLALPEAEIEAFIEAKAEEGKPVEDMTVKQLREEIQQWKSKAEVNANSVNEKERTINRMALDFNTLQDENKLLQRRLDDVNYQLKRQKPIIQAPADYEQLKRDLARARDEKVALQKKLDSAVRTIDVPADYHTNKKRLAELDSKIAAMQKKISSMQEEIDSQVNAEDYATVVQKLDTICALINDVSDSRNVGKVIADYERNHPSRYRELCACFTDFIRIMEMG